MTISICPVIIDTLAYARRALVPCSEGNTLAKHNKFVRIATRSSALALWQAEFVGAQLKAHDQDLAVELIPITTSGDKIIDRPLATIGGKGLFIKELEQALYDDRADIAVHSMKDLPAKLPSALAIVAILKREDPRDVLVVRNGYESDPLVAGARIGTSSVRRKSQLLARYPGLAITDLRGNVPTRLYKLDNGDFDAIVLAAAGLKRLELAARISRSFAPTDVVPAVGQGAIGIECRRDDEAICELVAALHDEQTGYCVAAERGFSEALDGGCDVPLAAYAKVTADARLDIQGLVASLDGQHCVRDVVSGAAANAREIGARLGGLLLRQGARDILADLRSSTPT